MSAGVLEAPVVKPTSTGPDECKHLIDGDRFDETMAAVQGDEVEALCGYRFIPTRDHLRLPPCKPCIQVLEALTNELGG